MIRQSESRNKRAEKYKCTDSDEVMNKVESGKIIANEENAGNEDIEDPKINELVKGMMLLYEDGVFHGKVSTIPLKAGNS